MAPHDVPPPLGDDRPLEGLKVIELASVLAGPLVGTFLAELGAERIHGRPQTLAHFHCELKHAAHILDVGVRLAPCHY